MKIMINSKRLRGMPAVVLLVVLAALAVRTVEACGPVNGCNGTFATHCVDQDEPRGFLNETTCQCMCEEHFCWDETGACMVAATYSVEHSRFLCPYDGSNCPGGIPGGHCIFGKFDPITCRCECDDRFCRDPTGRCSLSATYNLTRHEWLCEREEDESCEEPVTGCGLGGQWSSEKCRCQCAKRFCRDANGACNWLAPFDQNHLRYMCAGCPKPIYDYRNGGYACEATDGHCGDGFCDSFDSCRTCPEDCGRCDEAWYRLMSYKPYDNRVFEGQVVITATAEHIGNFTFSFELPADANVLELYTEPSNLPIEWNQTLAWHVEPRARRKFVMFDDKEGEPMRVVAHNHVSVQRAESVDTPWSNVVHIGTEYRIRAVSNKTAELEIEPFRKGFRELVAKKDGSGAVHTTIASLSMLVVTATLATLASL